MKVSLTNDGKWTEMPQRHISAIHYTQIFYFVVFDCDKSLHQYNPEMPQIEIEIKAFNEDSHFSQEEWWVLELETLMWISFFYLFVTTAWKYVRIVMKEEIVESPLALLVIGIFVELG